MTGSKPFLLALALTTTSIVVAGQAVASEALRLTESQLDSITAGGTVITADAAAGALGSALFTDTSTTADAGLTQGVGEAAATAIGDVAAFSTTEALGGIDGGGSGPDLLVTTGASADGIGDATTQTQSRVFVRDGRIVDIGFAASVGIATGLVHEAVAFADGGATGDIVIVRRLPSRKISLPSSTTALARVIVISINLPRR
jgi:hypothetical protein